MTRHQITLIGCGKMGSAMLQGWLDDDNLAADFVIIEPYADSLAWTASHDNVRIFPDVATASADAATAASRMIVLAVKPQMMDEALGNLGGLVGDATVFLSIAAGITCDWLRARLGVDAAIIRSMPNTPAAIGQGITAIYGGSVDADSQLLARQLLAATGQVVMLDDENLMDAVTAVSGSGPAYVFLLAEAMCDAGIAAGLPPELAKQLAEATVTGAGALIAASDEPPAQLRVNVTSKGGTTAAALDVLMADDGMKDLLERAIAAAKARSVALGG